MDSGRFGPIDLSGAIIGDGLYLSNSKVGGPSQSINCERVSVAGDLWLGYGAEFDGRIDCVFAKIGGSFVLEGGKFADVSLTGTRIGAELRLGEAGRTAKWSDAATLTLLNAQADAI